MGLERTRRIELLAERPPLTSTGWPPWSSTSPSCTSSSRPGGAKSRSGFVDIPDFFMLGWHRHLETAVYAPAPFIPHGALANARDLDARGRERHVWIRGFTAGSESSSMSCRRRSKRAACAATSTSSAAAP